MNGYRLSSGSAMWPTSDRTSISRRLSRTRVTSAVLSPHADSPISMAVSWLALNANPIRSRVKNRQGSSMHQFSKRQQIRKPAVTAKGGIVAAQSRKAAEVGAEILAAGGDCVDAVIATTFALGVLEPWMSGVGGGGAMVLYRARENRYEVVDYGMRAPNSLRVEEYPLTAGAASDIFPWPRV